VAFKFKPHTSSREERPHIPAQQQSREGNIHDITHKSVYICSSGDPSIQIENLTHRVSPCSVLLPLPVSSRLSALWVRANADPQLQVPDYAFAYKYIMYMPWPGKESRRRTWSILPALTSPSKHFLRDGASPPKLLSAGPVTFPSKHFFRDGASAPKLLSAGG